MGVHAAGPLSRILDVGDARTAPARGPALAPALLDIGAMAQHPLQGSLATAVPAPRRRRVPETVGACTVCGVKFAGSDGRRALVEEVLRVHQSICPGGTRGGHVVAPFE